MEWANTATDLIDVRKKSKNILYKKKLKNKIKIIL